MIKPRAYQEQAIHSILRYYDHGGQKGLVALATGLGKSYIALMTAMALADFDTDKPKRIIYLAHTKELIEQPRDSLFKLMPNLRRKHVGKAPATGIVRASRNQTNAQFLFTTMQTSANDDGKRLDEILSHGAFDLAIVDEVHHVAACSYADIIVPKLLEANPQTKLLGLTATPARSDGKALDTVFDDIVYQMNILSGINGGWLKPINAKSVQTEVNIGAIPRYNGDFQETALRNALRVQNWTEIIAKAYFEHDGPDRYAISFMPSVEMGRELCENFRNNGVPAASIDSEMVIDETGVVQSGSNGAYERARQRVIEAYRNGDIRVLGGYSVLLEGFDAPNTDMILQGRPTESEVLLTQLIGRGLRQPAGVARILQDKEKETYLVQRNGEDTWHEYKHTAMPYPTECLVLDFTLKDTSILLSGSLAGDRTETPDVEEAEKEVLEVVEATPVDNAYELILKQGKGVQYAKRNFFKLSTDNWTFWQDATMSAYLGCAGEGQSRLGNAMFIYPRQKMMVGRMNAVLDILDQMEGLEQEELEKTISTVRIFREAFSNFLVFQLTNIPVTVKEKNGYASEWIQWNSAQVDVKWLGMHVDHNAVWEAALPISQRLSVGGFFVDKKRPGARNKASSKQLDLMYQEKVNDKFPNIFHSLPAGVNAAFDTVPGLELFRIEKPVRKTLEDVSSVEVSGMLNHIGIYSAVMKQKLGAQLVQAQQLYNYWTALWQTT